MLTKIRVIPDTFVSKVLFFEEADLTAFKERVIPLFGPNGVGKSTLINAIENHKEVACITNGKPTGFYSYQNGRDNFKNRGPGSYEQSFDPMFLSLKFNARDLSEGQSIVFSIYDLLDGLKPKGSIPEEKGKDMLVLLDEIDSGMSIDNIDTTMRKIKKLAKARSDLQFLFSFNSPRVVKHFPHVLSMYDGKDIFLRNDEDMLQEIKKHKKEFDKARKYSNGRPKIF